MRQTFDPFDPLKEVELMPIPSLSWNPWFYIQWDGKPFRIKTIPFVESDTGIDLLGILERIAEERNGR